MLAKVERDTEWVATAVVHETTRQARQSTACMEGLAARCRKQKCRAQRGAGGPLGGRMGTQGSESLCQTGLANLHLQNPPLRTWDMGPDGCAWLVPALEYPCVCVCVCVCICLR
jgi:hypothetical protein